MLSSCRRTALAFAAVVSFSASTSAETVKVGLVLPMTGPLTYIGQQIDAGVKVFLAMNGTRINGTDVEVVVNDGYAPDAAKRAADELIVREKVAVLGVGLTPDALAIAPMSKQAKIPMLLMGTIASQTLGAGAPYMIRTGYTPGVQALVLARWAVANAGKKALLLRTNIPATSESAYVFALTFGDAGGQVVDSLTVGRDEVDFSPALQRVGTLQPDVLFSDVFPSQIAPLARQFTTIDHSKLDIRLLGLDQLAPDDQLSRLGDAMLGVITASVYSPLLPTPLNRDYASEFRKEAHASPTALSLSGFDSMRLIYEALRKTGGKTDGDTLIAAMRGTSWESPRGPITIDPKTGDIVQNVYIRKVEPAGGELANIVVATFTRVIDPGTLTQLPECCAKKVCNDPGICTRTIR